MDKIKNIFKNNRNIAMLGSIFLFGILAIGIMTVMENPDSVFGTEENEGTTTNYKNLQEKIKLFEKENYKPENYQTLLAEFDASYSNDLITVNAKNNLILELNNVLEKKVFNECEKFLISNSTYGINEVKGFLQQLQSATATSAKISYYNGQLIKYSYYSETLPNKIKTFTSDIYNYNENKLKLYLNEIENMPGFDSKYKNQQKFKNIKKQLKDDIDKFEFNYLNSPVDTTEINFDEIRKDI
ncbi:hypothetical protein [Flavobacterium facile]|uniref:hypothetical protein n=1 Tax=Flavobacterium facile TaxID=2893174 RepID=UPI002E75ECE9|nr:hypothetical protein [Flavobacterium sp. T-12]